MTSSSISFVWLALPLVAWLLWTFVPLFRVRFRWIFLATLLVGYCLLVGGIRLSGREMKQRMEEFDLDGNGE